MDPSWPKELLQAPIIPPPLGVVSNFTNPPDLAVAAYWTIAVSVILTTLIISLRLYSNIALARSCGADDYALLLGWALFMAFCAEIAIEARLGMGRHMWDIQFQNAMILFKHLYICLIIYAVATPVVKIAIFLQFLRIFNPSNRKGYMFWSCWISIVCVSIYYISIIFLTCFLCVPTLKFWAPWVPGQCGDRTLVGLLSAGANVTSDVVIIVLPQRTVWSLKIAIKQKIRVSMIFFLGTFALAASVYRLYYTAMLYHTTDLTLQVSKAGLWTIAEIVITVMCSSIPSIYGLFRHWNRRRRSASIKQSDNLEYGSASDPKFVSASISIPQQSE